jgi:hypothetical protein
MTCKMRGNRPEISYVVGLCVRTDVEAKVIMRACMEGSRNAKIPSSASFDG